MALSSSLASTPASAAFTVDSSTLGMTARYAGAALRGSIPVRRRHWNRPRQLQVLPQRADERQPNQGLALVVSDFLAVCDDISQVAGHANSKVAEAVMFVLLKRGQALAELEQWGLGRERLIEEVLALQILALGQSLDFIDQRLSGTLNHFLVEAVAEKADRTVRAEAQVVDRDRGRCRFLSGQVRPRILWLLLRPVP